MAAFPERLLVSGERVAVHVRPHWRMLVVPAVLPPVVAFAAAYLAAVVSSSGWATTWRTAGILADLVVALGVVGWFSVAPVLRWRATHFVVTDRRLLVREGLLARTGIVVVGASITAVRTSRTVTGRVLGCGTLEVGVDDAREPWRFEGLGRVERIGVEVERMAGRRGGLRADAADVFGVPDDLVDEDPDDVAEDVEDDPHDDLDDDDRGGWGAWRDDPDGITDAEWADDEDGIDPDRFPRLRRLTFSRRRALTAASPAEGSDDR